MQGGGSIVSFKEADFRGTRLASGVSELHLAQSQGKPKIILGARHRSLKWPAEMQSLLN